MNLFYFVDRENQKNNLKWLHVLYNIYFILAKYEFYIENIYSRKVYLCHLEFHSICFFKQK